MRDLLLVIDLQKVYADGAPWACRETGRAGAAVRRLLGSGKPAEVIFTRFDAPVQPRGAWGDYNRAYADINADARLGEFMDELGDAPSRWPVYSKSTYSSLTVPEVLSAARAADRVLLTGVVAECCVLATMMALIDEGVPVVYLSDAVAGQSEAMERSVAAVAAALSPVHTRVMTVGEYLAAT